MSTTSKRFPSQVNCSPSDGILPRLLITTCEGLETAVLFFRQFRYLQECFHIFDGNATVDQPGTIGSLDEGVFMRYRIARSFPSKKSADSRESQIEQFTGAQHVSHRIA